MNYFTSPDPSDGFHERRKYRTIMLDPISLRVHNDNAEAQTLEIHLELKTSVDRYEHIELSLCPRDQLRVR